MNQVAPVRFLLDSSRPFSTTCVVRVCVIFNPVAKGQSVKLNVDLARIEHWQKIGAKLSDRVQALVADYRKQAA